MRYLIENRNQAVLFDWVKFISVFFNSCWSYRFPASSARLCLYQERSSKLKVWKTLLTNYCKMIMWGHLRTRIKRRTPSIILVTASQFFKLSKLIGMWKLIFTVGKICISREVFFVWRITQTCQSQFCFRESMKSEIESEMVWNGKTWEIFLKLSYFRNQFVFFPTLLIVNVIFLHDLNVQYV